MITTDINPHAAVATVATGSKNKVSIDTVQTSLVASLLPRLYRSVDVLCFNPPYAVTPSSEIGGQGIEASWAGGIDGREVIDAMLPLVKVCKCAIICNSCVEMFPSFMFHRNFLVTKVYSICCS
jgi:methylase of polypeptide subunit release factors